MKKIFISSGVLIIVLVGCLFYSNAHKDLYIQLNKEMLQKKDSNNILLFSIYEHEFVLYNTTTFKLDFRFRNENFNDIRRLNYVQYSFPTKSNYYTMGDTAKNNYKIVTIDNNEIQKIFEFDEPAKFAIFPLATDGTHNFFTRYLYDKDGVARSNARRIVLLNDKNELVEFENTSGSIKGGAIIDNYLYYTAYVKETDSFSLYKIDISDNLSEPIHLEDNLDSEELFNYKGKLYKSNGEEIYCDEEPENRFKFCSYNYFDNENDVLIQIRVNENADLALSVTDITTKEILGEFISPINFDISENKLTVYCIGNIYHLDL